MNKEFVLYPEALELKELGFDEPCFGYYYHENSFTKCRPQIYYSDTFTECNPHEEIPLDSCKSPLYQQAINFLYICSNKQINIELKGSDTYEERVRKINQGCEDLRNLQNNKSNQ